MYLNNHNILIIIGDDLKADWCRFEIGNIGFK